MSSIIEGYNYDIFISYRQKDNKHDGWVTEFVDNLKGELESTFKEEISVYFDINPHDGLLETHDVDASLRDKLKCLVFIPIISRTYCDPKSFAWEHEFKAFIEQASQDQFGLKVKLPNGNIASRVLQIRIHELDAEDIKLCESVLGGVLRGIAFIYKESGFNRPLKPDDDEKINLNKTKYRNQIAKVALAIRDIITAIEHHGKKTEGILKEVVNVKPEQAKKLIPKTIVGSVIILALIVLGYFLIPTLIKPKEQLEKSIAVLPFINDSPDTTNTYFINGIMERITTNLQMVKAFRVISRTSVEQYRNHKTKSISEIAKELDVNYIIEGSGQKYGNSFSVTTQLIKAKDKETHLWAKTYDQEIKEVKDYIRIQSQIAQAVAAELKVVITPEEKKLIEKVPTANLTALAFYQRGREEEGKFPYYSLTSFSPTMSDYTPSIKDKDKQALEIAEKFYKTALKIDPEFAMAYSGLAGIYWGKNYNKEYFSENFLDSVLVLVNKAISFDDQLPDAHYIRGMYYCERGKFKQALADFDKTLNINSNYWLAYLGKSTLYINEDDYVMAIQNLQKALSLHHGAGLSDIKRFISITFVSTGFDTLASTNYLEAAKLETDSAKYYYGLYSWKGNFEFLKKGYEIDSTNEKILAGLTEYYSNIGQFKESMEFNRKYRERLKRGGILKINDIQRIGYVFSKIGLRDSATYFFKKQIDICNTAIKLGRIYGISFAYYDLAGVYAFMGDKKRAYENLNILNQRKSITGWLVAYIKIDSLFNNIRNEAEFKKIVKDFEAKCQAEHERVRKWLEEQRML